MPNNLPTQSPPLLPDAVLSFRGAATPSLFLPFSQVEGVALCQNSGSQNVSTSRWAGIPEELLKRQLTQVAEALWPSWRRALWPLLSPACKAAAMAWTHSQWLSVDLEKKPSLSGNLL